MVATVTTAGQKAAAQSHAKAVVAPPLKPNATAPTMHNFVPMQAFSLHWNGVIITFNAGQRYIAETAMKTVLQATDRDIVWET